MLQAIWWRPAAPPWPLRWLESVYVAAARYSAARKRRRAQRLPVPVIVVGNIAVGGSGKTPVTLTLIEALRAMGRQPGVLARGYGGSGPFPLRVQANTSPALAGDEPVLMAQLAGVPVYVAPDRFLAGKTLLAHYPEVDVLLCDDGLQHLQLQRDLEFCVIDGVRGHGNGHCLPAGPLREPPSRVAQCDLVLVNGGEASLYGEAALRFDLVAETAVHLHTGEQRALTDFAGQGIEAVAGIGNPQRFFDLLSAQGLLVHPHPFADHHDFVAADLQFAGGRPVLMTEKDAVKCRSLCAGSSGSLWVVPATARFSQDAHRRVQECLQAALAVAISS